MSTETEYSPLRRSELASYERRKRIKCALLNERSQSKWFEKK